MKKDIFVLPFMYYCNLLKGRNRTLNVEIYRKMRF